MTTTTPQGIELTPETIDDLARLVGEARTLPSTTGYHRSLMENARALAQRLRTKFRSDPAKLAQIDALVQP